MNKGLCIVHVAEDISRVTGGVPSVIRDLSVHQMKEGCSVRVVYTRGEVSDISQGVNGASYPSSNLWYWNPNFKKGFDGLLLNSKEEPSVVHIHGAWSAPQYLGAVVSARNNVPFVFSAHGMLEPWLWNNQGVVNLVKKNLYWALIASSAFSKSAIIHAITPMEKNNLSQLFPKNRIEIIPNAIEIAADHIVPKFERKKSILFLGRIEPKKGVDLLIRSFGLAALDSDWTLDLVGPVWSEAYLKKLLEIVREFKIESRVIFHGPLFGEAKANFINKSWVLVAPSYSEVVGLVNLEASVNRLPTITTYQTGLFDWEDGGGMLIDPNVDSLLKALKNASSWTPSEQYERGESSRLLVKRRYSWDVTMPMWLDLYNSLLG